MIGARKTPCVGSDPRSRSPSRQPLPHPLRPRICFVALESLCVKFPVFFASLYQPLRTHAAAAGAAAAASVASFSFGTHCLLIARAKFLEGKSGGEENHDPYASSVGVCAPFFPTPSPAFLAPVLISKLAGCPCSFPCLLNFLVAGGDVAIASSFLLRLLHTVRETETVLDLHGQRGKMLQSIGLTLLVIVATLFFVLLFMLCGWCVVWQLFLSKFKFLRELIGDTGSQQGDNENAEAEAEQDALLLTPQRNRQKPARQRKGPAEEAS